MSTFQLEQRLKHLAALMGWRFREAVGCLYLIKEKLNTKKTVNVWDIYESGRCSSMDEARRLMKALIDAQILNDFHIEKGEVIRLDFKRKPIRPNGGGAA